ncbi:hypothetical protein H1C71_027616, partial [Ictidomys tridecemlineatus]
QCSGACRVRICVQGLYLERNLRKQEPVWRKDLVVSRPEHPVKVVAGPEVGLRQLDVSLLCQLYSLYESIQEYKGACQASSSPDCTCALENGFSDEEEEGFQDQSSLREGQDGGPPGSLPLPVPHLSGSDWILESI